MMPGSSGARSTLDRTCSGDGAVLSMIVPFLGTIRFDGGIVRTANVAGTCSGRGGGVRIPETLTGLTVFKPVIACWLGAKLLTTNDGVRVRPSQLTNKIVANCSGYVKRIRAGTAHVWRAGSTCSRNAFFVAAKDSVSLPFFSCLRLPSRKVEPYQSRPWLIGTAAERPTPALLFFDLRVDRDLGFR